MSSVFQVRQAKLDDTQAISQLLRARITAWQRLDEQGRVHDLSYDVLSIYDRWLHGGAWMSIETSAIWLNHLLRGAGITLVAEKDNEIVGYAEAFKGHEPEPFGKHLHVARLVAKDDRHTIRHAIMQALVEIAQEQALARVTVAFSAYDQESQKFYSQFEMEPLIRVGRYTIPAHTGQGFYKATDHHLNDSAQISGWHMPIGHVESARQQWEHLWPKLWEAIDEIKQRRIHRLHFSSAGQNALVICEQHLYEPRTAEVYCWSPMPLKPQLVTAICDWAHRANYRRLVFAVPEAVVKTLGTEAEPHPFLQDIYSLNL